MGTQKPTIHIAGAGLAGSECALQLADLGYDVVLIEMRGEISTPAHRTTDCAELVCSNSFGSLADTSAPGLLKWEAEQMGSKILDSAYVSRVPAGQALSMDREVFAREMTAKIEAHPRIRLERRVIRSLDELPRPCVVATGPLTHDDLAKSMQQHFGDEFLYFFDAIAPIVAADSINMNIAWRADRWDKGTKDYINCPLTKKEYHFFIQEMKDARKTEAKDFEKDTPYFESCMPIEAMLERGDLTPRFGPMSAKGLTDPRTGNWPFAVVQLRQDNREGTAYNIVGFQTKMAYAEQKRVFRLIPGLEEAEFLKLGSIHRNLYINTPKRLNRDLSSKKDPMLFFAGQITGVEGYFESTCMGLLVSRFVDAKVQGRLASDASNIEEFVPPRATAFGSLLDAITDVTKIDHFQPTNINFGHLPPIEERMPKDQKRALQIQSAKKAMLEWISAQGLTVRGAPQTESASQALRAIIEAAKAAEAAAQA
ncbi:MAG TPA: methylenetetrahydrofolate--tRNA-(uracil(54)-C(5))-methyltransferase (FADH(2)-oxidizing) TrmFO [Bdellovibrionales bacterium]|nr:methylenetetrahydrofolate--tRNA-(uracil(54)-C(5))-methyltransferase (FADH(2)-oxidizing) TrmFO [Bdellovibrionales bacterium]